MLLTALMLLVALALSSVAAFYSIVGLAAIFAGAAVPIIIMGSILEVAKLVVTVWLHEYWSQCRWIMKLYLVPAVGVLMLLTSMGIFGFLSKAHLDQGVPTGDIAAQVSLIDEKIKTQRDNIEANRRALSQMDATVDQTISRSSTEQGATNAANLRRSQQRERGALQNEIAAAQKAIAQLNEERAPVASQLRKVEAEVGPIKYIAALIYGDNPDANLLERAVRWVIIVLVAVFDPLAVIMLLAFTESLGWERQRRAARVVIPPSAPPPQPKIDEPQATTETVVFPPRVEDPEPDASDPEPVVSDPPKLAGPIEIADPEPEIGAGPDSDEDTESDPRVKEAMRLWKQQNPGHTVKYERQRFRQGLIPELPWMSLLDQLPREPRCGFGADLPADPIRGDTWVNTATIPNTLYKFNGQAWIPVDKDINDSYTYDEAYIDFLIERLDQGQYDPELLSTHELDQITQRLHERSTKNL
jgi:hypothetical protein